MIPYRDDNPTELIPWVNYALVAVNAAVFLGTLPQHERWVWELGFVPWELLRGDRMPGSAMFDGSVALLTSMFMHGGFMHLGGNMLFLWVFGDNVEDAMGHLRYLLFYVATGLAAHAVQLGHTAWIAGAPPAAALSRDAAIAAIGHSTAAAWFVPTVGASGAISGVMAAYYILYRRHRVMMLVPIGFFLTTMAVPAGFAIGYWFVIQLLSGIFSSGAGGGVAWWAHVGGFVGGAALVQGFLRRRFRNELKLRRTWARMRSSR